jgi:hypothetical protein
MVAAGLSADEANGEDDVVSVVDCCRLPRVAAWDVEAAEIIDEAIMIRPPFAPNKALV